MIKVLILVIGIAIVATISIVNDYCVEKHGGETQYIWEEGVFHGTN